MLYYLQYAEPRYKTPAFQFFETRGMRGGKEWWKKTKIVRQERDASEREKGVKREYTVSMGDLEIGYKQIFKRVMNIGRGLKSGKVSDRQRERKSESESVRESERLK